MRNVTGNLWIPDEGYKYITDGVTYTDSIYLGKNHDIANWHDTNDEPPEPDPGEEEATAEDYEQALADLGVRV